MLERGCFPRSVCYYVGVVGEGGKVLLLTNNKGEKKMRAKMSGSNLLPQSGTPIGGAAVWSEHELVTIATYGNRKMKRQARTMLRRKRKEVK